MWKNVADSKKAKHPSKEEIKKQSLETMIIDENFKFDDLHKKAEEIREPEKAAEIIKQDEDITKTEKKRIISVAFHQGMVFKRLKEKEKFVNLVSKLGIHKTTIIFKINVFKLCKKYPKTIEVFHRFSIFKNFHKTFFHKKIKAICEENEKDFQC